jgi:hypothetical protein
MAWVSWGRCEEDGHEELETYVTRLAILQEDKAIIGIYEHRLPEKKLSYKQRKNEIILESTDVTIN